MIVNMKMRAAEREDVGSAAPSGRSLLTGASPRTPEDQSREPAQLRGLSFHMTLAMQLTPKACDTSAPHNQGPFPAFNGRHTEPAP